MLGSIPAVHIRCMDFKHWLENSQRTGAKLGNYSPQSDALGAYPPLYGISGAADLITYLDIMYGVNNIPGKDGIIRYAPNHFHKPNS